MGDEPFRLLAAGCGGFVQHGGVAPHQCLQEPVVVGLVMIGEPGRRRALWRGFACDIHAGELLATRALLPRDRALLAYRREAWRTQLDGRRWSGAAEQPIAWGREADELLARAQAWAERHPRVPRTIVDGESAATGAGYHHSDEMIETNPGKPGQ